MDFKKISLLFLLVAGLVNSAHCDEMKDCVTTSFLEEVRELDEWIQQINNLMTSEIFIDFEIKQLAFEQNLNKVAEVCKKCVGQGLCDEVEFKLFQEQMSQSLNLKEEAIQKIQLQEAVDKAFVVNMLLLKRSPKYNN